MHEYYVREKTVYEIIQVDGEESYVIDEADTEAKANKLKEEYEEDDQERSDT
jgi:hypothetical protein